MKMTEEQKAAYKAYRKECRMSNVEPVRVDFLAGESGRSTPHAQSHYLHSRRLP